MQVSSNLGKISLVAKWSRRVLIKIKTRAYKKIKIKIKSQLDYISIFNQICNLQYTWIGYLMLFIMFIIITIISPKYEINKTN